MIEKKNRKEIRLKKHIRIRNRFKGTASCPRLTVFKSDKHIYAQIIDDDKQITLCSSSSMDKKLNLAKTNTVEAASIIGKDIGEKAKAQGITNIVFDRSGYIYHGKVKALADSAREAGLVF